MRRTQSRTLSIGFGQRVGKLHHTMRIGTVAKPICVTELVDRVRRDSTPELDVGSNSLSILVLAQTSDRENCDAARWIKPPVQMRGRLRHDDFERWSHGSLISRGV